MQKYDLFDLLKMLEEKDNDIQTIFNGGGYLDKEISILWSIIETNFGIKKTQTCAMYV